MVEEEALEKSAKARSSLTREKRTRIGTWETVSKALEVNDQLGKNNEIRSHGEVRRKSGEQRPTRNSMRLAKQSTWRENEPERD